MKIKNWLKSLISGIAIGVSSAIPGVSGGTVAIILKVYEKILWAVANIFKSFKKAIIILIPILIGLIIGIVPTIVLMDKALQYFLFGTVCIFAGFIIGSLPEVTNEIKGEKPSRTQIIILICAFILAIGLGILSVVAKADVSSWFANPQWWLYLVLIPVGFIASIALVVPGISGGMLLILIGFYTPLINSTVDAFEAAFKNGDWSKVGSQCGILACFLIGALIGFFLISKLMNILLNKYRRNTFFGILGFIFGSIIALFVNFEIFGYYTMWQEGKQGYVSMNVEIILGVILLIICALASFIVLRTLKKKTIEVKE